VGEVEAWTQQDEGAKEQMDETAAVEQHLP
jgi:hypothetical protein